MPKLLLKEETYPGGNGCDCCSPTTISVFNVYVDGQIERNVQGHDVESALFFFLEELGYEVKVEYEGE